MATPLGYCIQFNPSGGKDGGLNEYLDVGLGLRGALVTSLIQVLPKIANSNYVVTVIFDKSFITQISERKRNMWNRDSKG